MMYLPGRSAGCEAWAQPAIMILHTGSIQHASLGRTSVICQSSVDASRWRSCRAHLERIKPRQADIVPNGSCHTLGRLIINASHLAGLQQSNSGPYKLVGSALRHRILTGPAWPWSHTIIRHSQAQCRAVRCRIYASLFTLLTSAYYLGEAQQRRADRLGEGHQMLHVDCLDFSIGRGQIDHYVKQVCSQRQVHAAAEGLHTCECARISRALTSTACQRRTPPSSGQ